MLRHKFFSKPSAPPAVQYYQGVARTANAGAATVSLGFAADLVISKRRNGVSSASWFDRLRGALKRISSPTTAAEVTDTNSLVTFTATGFTLGADTPQVINAPNGAAFMHWCFNEAPGYFDTAVYTGDGEFIQTVAHDLTVPPELAVAKNLTGVQLWPVYHSGAAGRDLVLSSANASSAPTGNYKAQNTTLASSSWVGVAYGNGVYVAARRVSGGNTVAVSSDGKTWVNHTVGPMPVSGANSFFCTITFCSFLGVFVGIGTLSSFISADGITWTKGTDYGVAINPPEQGVAASASLLVVVNGTGTLTSSDGFTWLQQPGALGIPANAIEYGGTSFVVLAQSATNAARWSDDGLTWGTAATPVTGRSWRHIAFGNGVFIAVATLPNSPPADVTNIQIRSLDFGRTWSTIAMATTQSWGGITFGNGIFLAGGADTAQASDQSNVINISFDNGQTWQARTLQAFSYWMFWAYGAPGFVGVSYAVNPTIGQLVQLTPGSPYLMNPQPGSIDVGTAINTLGSNYVLYLFASLLGVSKVSAYTGNGVTQNIDCQFTASARFVLIKRRNGSGDWFIWDSARGINVGTNDPYLTLNQGAAEVATDNAVEPFATGFTVVQSAVNINVNGAEYVFLAIA